MKNNIKAMAYVAIGITGVVLSLVGIAAMFFSGDFLPVYVGNVYVIGNRIMRWVLYALLAVITVLSAKLAEYGVNFLTKKFFRKIKRR